MTQGAMTLMALTMLRAALVLLLMPLMQAGPWGLRREESVRRVCVRLAGVRSGLCASIRGVRGLFAP
eukprot:13960-Eustigmatos_ZCMA.PRE.1